MIKIYNKRYAHCIPRDSVVIDTTSYTTKEFKMLSPFYLGPVKMWKGIVAQNMENAWQFSKVYPQHVDKNGVPTADWVQWAATGWRDKRAHRYPMGKGKKPLYSFWNGEFLDYISARKKIYCPLYAETVEKTDSYKKLKELAEPALLDKTNLYLIDFDGYDHHYLGLHLSDVVENTKRPMGHAFVLLMMLEKRRYWER